MSRRWASVLAIAVLAAAVAGCGAPSFNLEPATAPDGQVGQPYDVALSGMTSTGGDIGELALSLDSGSLPPGISLRQGDQSGTRAGIAGTPTAAGTYTFKVYAKGGQCTMAGCPNGSRDYTLVIAP